MDKLKKEVLEKELLAKYKTAIANKANEMKDLQLKLEMKLREINYIEGEIEKLEAPK